MRIHSGAIVDHNIINHEAERTSSIMNIGRELRKRHLAAVVAELNKLVPNLTFTIATPVL